jgi:hypothetical protein
MTQTADKLQEFVEQTEERRFVVTVKTRKSYSDDLVRQSIKDQLNAQRKRLDIFAVRVEREASEQDVKD